MKRIYSGTLRFQAAAVGLVLVLGCQREHSHSHHDPSHEDEPAMAQITVWTDRYELFVEHSPPIAGRRTTFITHVTDLRTLEPRRHGPVEFVFRQNDLVAEHPQAAPAQPGIYLPRILFPNAGQWHLTVWVPTEGTDERVELGTIRVYADEHAAAHAASPDAPEGISFLKEQQWRIGLKTGPAAKHRLVERVRVPARVRAKPGYSATVATAVSGRLIAPAGVSWPQPGQPVSAGEVLALLEPNFSEAAARVAEAQAEFNVAKAALAHAESAHSRVKELVAQQARSPRELEEAALAYQSAEARFLAAAGLIATFRQADDGAPPDGLLMELRAPVTGLLNAVTAGPGEVMAAGQSIFTVLNPETVWIEASFPETGLARVRAGGEAVVEFQGDPGRFISITGDERGRLVSIGLEVDAATRTVPLIYETANREGQFRVGQNLTLYVETDAVEEGPAIPYSALVEEGGLFVAYIQVAGETFQKRDLRLGVRDGEWIQVLSGLAPGERVVTRGAYAIRLASAAGAIPAHGHTH